MSFSRRLKQNVPLLVKHVRLSTPKLVDEGRDEIQALTRASKIFSIHFSPASVLHENIWR